MKLIYKIIGSISLSVFFLLGVWALLTYFTLMKELNDEMDESLEDMAEMVIKQSLSGNMPDPSKTFGSPNLVIAEVTPGYAEAHPDNRFSSETFYLSEMEETVLSRVLRTVFQNPDGRFYEVIVAQPSFEKDDFAESLLYLIILLYTSMLILLIAVIVAVFRRNMRPFYKVIHWLENYNPHTSNKPLDNPTNISEFQKLNRTVTDFTRKSQEAFEQQKEFIGNASHEMQTPLAVSMNRLEILADESPTLSENDLNEIMKTRHTLNQIIKMNKSLLLLSKIDNDQFPEAAPISFDVLVEKHLGIFAEAYSHKNIRVKTDIREAFIHTMNDSLADIIVVNLLKNAYIYSDAGSEISVSMTPDAFVVSNTASDGPLDEEKIFERFYRQTTQKGSSGLGLAIAKGIGKISRLQIDYAYRENRHVFTVSKQ